MIQLISRPWAPAPLDRAASAELARSLEVPFAVAKGIAGFCKALGPLTLGKSKSWFPDPVLVEMASRHWGLKSRYAQADLGYEPRCGTETLRDTLDWLAENPPQDAH